MLHDFLKPRAFRALAAGLSLALICGCNSSVKEPPSLSVSWYVEREDNLISDDRYKIVITFYHTEPQSISGRYIVRAHGAVFGTGGQDDGMTDNYDESQEMTMEPGQGGGFQSFYYINDPDLRENNIPLESVKLATHMRFLVTFIPAASEQRVSKYALKYVISAGEGRFVNDAR